MRNSQTPPTQSPSLSMFDSPIDVRWAIGLLFGLVLLSYTPAMMGGFIWDDDQYVTDNVHIRTVDGLWRMWFEPGATPQYYPLVFSTFWVEYKLWGLHPAGFHLVNILLHALNAVLLFRILDTLKVPGAFFAAALFAVAPVHVESVAWVTERKNVLSGTFYLLAFLSYWRFESRRASRDTAHAWRRWAAYILALLFFGCALMSKSVTCSLPAAILLVLWWKNGRLTIQNMIALLPMFAIGIAAGLNTVSMERHHVGAQGIDWQWSLIERFLIASRILWFYAMKFLWPQPLIFIYPKWQIDASAWWQYSFGIGAVALVVWLWVARGRLGRGPLVAVLYYAGTLFPALGFIDVYPMRFSFVADHFVYLASIGLISLMAAGAATVASKIHVPKPWAIACAAVVLGMFMRVSFVRCIDYLDRETLWIATLAKNPDCWMANANLGTIRFKQQRYREAIPLLRRALRDKVNDEPNQEEKADLHYHLGASLIMLGNPEQGSAHFRQAIEYYERLADSETIPTAETHNNLGTLYGQLQQYDESIRHFRLAAQIDPSRPDAMQNLGQLFLQLKRFDEGAACFRKVLEIDPQDARAHYALGVISMNSGRSDEAIEHLREALRIDPGFAAAQAALQQALAQ